MRWGPILNVLLSSLSFLPSRAKEFHFRCHPLVMASLSGLLISVWGIALWGAVRALNAASFAAASAFSFPRTLTCPGTKHRSMIILTSSALRISSLVSAKIGDKEESNRSAKRALLVRKNCEPIAVYGSLQDFMHSSIYCVQFCCEYWSLSGKSATSGGVRKHCCKAHAFSGLRAICINMYCRMPLLVCQESGSHFFVE